MMYTDIRTFVFSGHPSSSENTWQKEAKHDHDKILRSAARGGSSVLGDDGSLLPRRLRGVRNGHTRQRRRGIPRDRLETNGDQLDDTTRAFAAAPPKTTLHVFERESGANAHCQLDNPPLSAAVLFDWLDERLR